MPSTGADKVLVVEDDPDIRELVTMALEDEGFQVEEARDGAAAIQAIDYPRPLPERLCLILLDMMMPNYLSEKWHESCGSSSTRGGAE